MKLHNFSASHLEYTDSVYWKLGKRQQRKADVLLFRAKIKLLIMDVDTSYLEGLAVSGKKAIIMNSKTKNNKKGKSDFVHKLIKIRVKAEH